MALLDDASRKSLLVMARAAIARAIGAVSETPVADPIPNPQSPIPGDFRAGAFVTLRIKGELRGCIGYPEPELRLIEVVERCAVSAAISDPRFPPLRPPNGPRSISSSRCSGRSSPSTTYGNRCGTGRADRRVWPSARTLAAAGGSRMVVGRERVCRSDVHQSRSAPRRLAERGEALQVRSRGVFRVGLTLIYRRIGD